MKLTSFIWAIVVGALGMILFPYWIITLNNRLDLPVYNHPLIDALGIISILAGIGLFIYCSIIFKFKGKGSPVPIEPPTKLVVTDIYAHTRNPIYLGYWLMILGEFLFFGHSALLGYLLLFMVINHIGVVNLEEPQLKRRFGDSYEEYFHIVPRYLPRLL